MCVYIMYVHNVRTLHVTIFIFKYPRPEQVLSVINNYGLNHSLSRHERYENFIMNFSPVSVEENHFAGPSVNSIILKVNWT